MTKKHFLLAALPVVIMAGCASGPKEIEQGLTPPEYFQRAQQAVIERNDYDTALAYYQTVLDQFSNDKQNGVIARYEIAFIYYKQGEFDQAAAGFTEILEIYDDDDTASELPAWPPVL